MRRNFGPQEKMYRTTGPEAIIQDAIVKYLRAREWLVKETIGNMFQSGFPDVYAVHSKYGQRWIEVKNPTSYKFTPAQMEFFPKLIAHGAGVWVLMAATDEEYKKLWLPCNFAEYAYRNIFTFHNK